MEIVWEKIVSFFINDIIWWRLSMYEIINIWMPQVIMGLFLLFLSDRMAVNKNLLDSKKEFMKILFRKYENLSQEEVDEAVINFMRQTLTVRGKLFYFRIPKKSIENLKELSEKLKKEYGDESLHKVMIFVRDIKYKFCISFIEEIKENNV